MIIHINNKIIKYLFWASIICSIVITVSYYSYIYVAKLNQYSNLLLVIITTFNVIITAFYAYQTYVMAKMMNTQIKSDIYLDKINLYSCLSGSNPNNLEKIINYPIEDLMSQTFDFLLSFYISNKASCSGSINKPNLSIKIRDFTINLSPITKYYEFEGSKVKDLGGVVFIRGGDMQIIEVNYNTERISELEKRKFLEYIKNNKIKAEEIVYSISYQDNMGLNYANECIVN